MVYENIDLIELMNGLYFIGGFLACLVVLYFIAVYNKIIRVRNEYMKKLSDREYREYDQMLRKMD